MNKEHLNKEHLGGNLRLHGNLRRLPQKEHPAYKEHFGELSSTRGVPPYVRVFLVHTGYVPSGTEPLWNLTFLKDFAFWVRTPLVNKESVYREHLGEDL